MTTTTMEDGTVAFLCNGCGQEFETETDDFKEALNRLRASDWSFKRNYSRDPPRWEHYCSLCSVFQGAV